MRFWLAGWLVGFWLPMLKKIGGMSLTGGTVCHILKFFICWGDCVVKLSHVFEKRVTFKGMFTNYFRCRRSKFN